MINLDELDRLHAAATPGPWCDDADINPEDVSIYQQDEWLANCGKPFKMVGQIVESEADNARLIVALRNAWPALSAELRTRRKQVEEARRAMERHLEQSDDECMCGNGPNDGNSPWCGLRAAAILRSVADAIDRGGKITP